MKTIVVGLTGLLVTALVSGPAAAWSHANSMGGSTSHSYGSTSHTNRYGGSSQHAYGEAHRASNAYGGSTGARLGWRHHTHQCRRWHDDGRVRRGRGPYAATGYSTYHPPYPATGAYAPYHPPVAVPYYASGCYNCGGAAAAGAVIGMATGAAIASANTAAATSNAYAAGVATGSANTAGAYSSGYAAGATTAVAAAPSTGRGHDDHRHDDDDHLRDGHELCRRAGGFVPGQQERHHVLSSTAIRGSSLPSVPTACTTAWSQRRDAWHKEIEHEARRARD